MLRKYFIDNRHDVTIITSDYSHFDKTRKVDRDAHSIYVPTKAYTKNLSIQRLISHHCLAIDIFKIVSVEFDLIWVLVPPNSFVKQAAKFKKQHPQIKVIFDVIDMWPETFPIQRFKGTIPFKYWRTLRDKNLSVADYVVTECDLFRNILINNVRPDRLTTLYLAREIKTFNPNLYLSTDELHLCYLGSINNIIDIQCISKIVETLSLKQSVVFHLIGDGEKKSELLANIVFPAVKIIDHGKVYDSDEKQKIFAQCHYGLNIMKPSVFVGLTLKSMDYFESGLPIINNIVGDTWKFIDRYKIGINTIDGNCDVSVKEYDLKMRSDVRTFFEEHLSSSVFYNQLDYITNLLLEEN